MKKLFTTLSNIWKIQELKERILFTLMILVIYRVVCQVVLPGVDPAQLVDTQKTGILGLLDMFAGGAFSKVSIVALGVMPYISASIVVQLLGIAVPSFQKMQKEGESGRKKLTQYTRYLTVFITAIQAIGYVKTQIKPEAILIDLTTFYIMSGFVLTAGTLFVMWLGEKITDKGIGNGISLLIMVGIIARLPEAFLQEFVSTVSQDQGGPVKLVFEVVLWLLIIIASILLVMAVRKIPVQYARRTAGGDFEQDMMGGNRQFIPLKLNASGVMPIIFAQAIMFIPAAVAGLSSTEMAQSVTGAFSDMFGFWYNVVFALLIIVFTYFYTAITVPTNKMADDLKRSGGFIPGVRPGAETSDFLDKVMSLITFPGSLFLALIAVFPAIVVSIMDVQQSWAMFFGGTSLIIMVGVAIDTIQQINSYLLNKHYDGLMKTGKNRKAVA